MTLRCARTTRACTGRNTVNPGMPADTGYGDVAAGLAGAAARVAVTYTTPVQHNNPMEPHAAIASWGIAPEHGAGEHGRRHGPAC